MADSYQDLIQRTTVHDFKVLAAIQGGGAGNHTVTGIATRDVLLHVLNITDGGDLVSEFTISAANTINNTGGTDTTGDDLLIVYGDIPEELG